MERSALASMVVGSLEVLLARLLSHVGELTVAVLVAAVPSGVLDGVSTTSLMVGAVVPLVRAVDEVQVMMGEVKLHTQPVPVAETYCSGETIVSRTVIGVAAVDGPLLVTVRVYVPSAPALKLPLWLLVTWRSARPMYSSTVFVVLVYTPLSFPEAPVLSVAAAYTLLG